MRYAGRARRGGGGGGGNDGVVAERIELAQHARDRRVMSLDEEHVRGLGRRRGRALHPRLRAAAPVRTVGGAYGDAAAEVAADESDRSAVPSPPATTYTVAVAVQLPVHSHSSPLLIVFIVLERASRPHRTGTDR